jgi:hypothetical protein
VPDRAKWPERVIGLPGYSEPSRKHAVVWNNLLREPFAVSKFTSGETKVKKFVYVIAAFTTIAIAAPAFAQDKPMMGDDGMKKPMHHHMMKKHHMMMHHKKMMKKDEM